MHYTRKNGFESMYSRGKIYPDPCIFERKNGSGSMAYLRRKMNPDPFIVMRKNESS